MRKNSVAIVTISVATLLSSFVTLLIQPSQSTASKMACKPIEVIFARGSGGGTEELRRFKDQLSRYINTEIYTLYNLGETFQAGYQYDPVGISGKDWDNGVGAWVSAGYANDYGKSVKVGTSELAHYFVNKSSDCPDSKFILAGYSQGAQVIGQFLNSIEDSSYIKLRERIIYVALFGDPKLHLPEGEGINPPACRGEQLSSYRRSIGNCNTDNGILGARKPYLPADMHTKTGLWCQSHDPICGSSKLLWDNKGHGTYASDYGPIDQAAEEVAHFIQPAAPIDLTDYIPRPADESLDIVFALATPRTFPASTKLDALPYIKTFLLKKQNLLVNTNINVGMTTSQSSSLCLNQPLNPLLMGSFMYWNYPLNLRLPGEPVNELLSCTLNQNWRPNVHKIIILIDNGNLSTISSSNQVPSAATLMKLAERIRAQAPATLYILTPDPTYTPFIKLINEIGGSITEIDTFSFDRATNNIARRAVLSSQPSPFESSLESIIAAQEENPPVAKLQNTDYRMSVGASATFDASSSYGDSPIVQYQWDFDGDETIDQITTTPVVKHTYTTAFNGIARVAVKTKKGFIASTTADIKVGASSTTSRISAPKLVITETTDTSVTIQWTPHDSSAAAWAIAVDGIPLGKTHPDRTTTTIGDLDRGEDITISVTPLSIEGEIGISAIATLPALSRNVSPGAVNDTASSQNFSATASNNLQSSKPENSLSTQEDTEISSKYEMSTTPDAATKHWITPALISIAVLIIGSILHLMYRHRYRSHKPPNDIV